VKKDEIMTGASEVSLMWLLNGGGIWMIFRDHWETWTIYTFDLTSGEKLPPASLQSTPKPHLWAYNTSFQIMTMGQVNQVPTISIFEVGSVLTKIGSFHIGLETRGDWVGPSPWKQDYQINSFSPTTYHISISAPASQILILDIRDSRCLLKRKGLFTSSCFSSDGSLSAASSLSSVTIRKYTSDHYTPWREFPIQDWSSLYGSVL
jgi:hypothetical protein